MLRSASSRCRPPRLLLSTALAAVLAGCGGGADAPPDTSAATATTRASADEQTAIAESAAWGHRAQAMAVTAEVPTLTIRARADLAAGVGPHMEVRIDGKVIGATDLTRADDWADYTFSAPTLRSGARVEVVFTNDAVIDGADRNLRIAYLSSGSTTVLPTTRGAVVDQGVGTAAFDGKDLLPGQGTLWGNSALRLTWPVVTAPAAATLVRRRDAARFLAQATFGPTPALLDTLATQTYTSWISTQMALPVSGSYVAAVQARYNLGSAYRPGGTRYEPGEVRRTFWRQVAGAPDALRKRVAFALHEIFMISMLDSNLWQHSRAYAAYLDLLDRHAFGNFRTLLEDVAMSPAMGIYLSHLRNRPEDPVSGRMPDENFAREIMQLFTIGLHELNNDGTPKLDATGQPIETYTSADVMALAKVFTGYSWAFPDTQLDESTFRWADPDYSAGKDHSIDLQRMKAYPGQHSTAEKKLFAGKPWAVTLPAGASASADLRLALDALFRHPNVGPFISRQLIQHLVTSHPSPAYVDRVARVFNNNGKGTRGDLAAVVRAILLDTEARSTPPADSAFGKLREPVLGVAQWMRAFGVTFANSGFDIYWQLEPTGQSPQLAPSVFGYFRPGYVPPGTDFASRGATAPEFQIVTENTVAAWVNLAEQMGSDGLGWFGNQREIVANYTGLVSRLTGAGSVGAMVDEIDLLLFGARMSPALRQTLIEAAASVEDGYAQSNLYRARLAVFLATASPEYLVQR
jgi:uncharacterized protein (DUF1800 family)